MSPQDEKNIGFVAWFAKWVIIGRITVTTFYILIVLFILIVMSHS